MSTNASNDSTNNKPPTKLNESTMSIYHKFLNSIPQIKLYLLKELLSDNNDEHFLMAQFLNLIFDIQIMTASNLETDFDENKTKLLFEIILN